MTRDKRNRDRHKAQAHSAMNRLTLTKHCVAHGKVAPMLVQMCAIGEETGSLDVMLQRAAQLMENEVNQGLASFSTLLEPTLMLILGTLIGGILVALYLPIFNLGQVF